MNPKGAFGLVILAAAAWIAWEIYKLSGAASQAYAKAEDSVLNAIVPDANAAVQSTTQEELAELRAAGNPPVGSPAYNTIVSKYNPAQVVTTAGGSGE